MIVPYTKKFWQVSVSQARAKKRCQRYWCFSYPYGIRFTHPSAALGTLVHAQGERLLTDGTPPADDKAGQILRSGLQFLPQTRVQPCVECTAKLPMEQVPGIVFFGKIDALWLQDPRMIIQDWKTTGDLHYAKTEGQLKLDLQFLLYSRWAMLAHQRVEAQGLWIYMQTKGKPRAIARTPTVTLADTDSAWDHFQQESKEITCWHKQQLQIQDTEPNYESCSQYGGCPYRHVCQEQWDLITKGEESRMTMLEKLLAESQQPAQGAVQAQPPAPPPAAVAVPAAFTPPIAPPVVQTPVVAPPVVAPPVVAPPVVEEAENPTAYYQALLLQQPALHPTGDLNDVNVPQICVVCGKIDERPKTWVPGHDYIPEYPNGCIIHTSPGGCMDRLLEHRGGILDGSIERNTPLQLPPEPEIVPAPARELTPEEAANLAGFDDVNPPESDAPRVIKKEEAPPALKKSTKKSVKEQARYDQLFCAVVASSVGGTAAQIKETADEYWEVLK